MEEFQLIVYFIKKFMIYMEVFQLIYLLYYCKAKDLGRQSTLCYLPSPFYLLNPFRIYHTY